MTGTVEQLTRLPNSILAFSDDAAFGDQIGRLVDGGKVPKAELMPGGLSTALCMEDIECELIMVEVGPSINSVDGVAALSNGSSSQNAKGNRKAIARERDVLWGIHTLYCRCCESQQLDISELEGEVSTVSIVAFGNKQLDV